MNRLSFLRVSCFLLAITLAPFHLYAQMRSLSTVNMKGQHTKYGGFFMESLIKMQYTTAHSYVIDQKELSPDSLRSIAEWLKMQLPPDFYSHGVLGSSKILNDKKAEPYLEITYYKWMKGKINYFCQIRILFDVSQPTSGKRVVKEIILVPSNEVKKRDRIIKRMEKEYKKLPPLPPSPPSLSGKD